MTSADATDRQGRPRDMLVWIVVFASGVVLMATEVLAFRLVARAFGSALRETTAVIAVFLAAMSIGYWQGGRAGDRRPRRSTLITPLAVAALWLPLLPLADRGLSDAVARSELPFATHALAVSALLFFVPVAMLAAVSPIAIRLLTHNVVSTGRIAGGISAVSAVGSIAGTVLAGFYLVGAFPISGTFRGLGVALALLAGALVLRIRSRRSLVPPPGPLAALLVLATAPIPAPAEVLYERDSAYHHIRVVDRDGYRHLLFDDTNQSRMLLRDPSEGGYEYTRYFHMIWLFEVDIDDVLFIGLGGGTGPKEFLRDYPDLGVRVAEIDPAVVRVCRKYFALPSDDRLRIETADGRVALRRMRDRVDVIVIDAYTSGRYGSTVPFHLTTEEFFELARDRIQDDGMIVYNVIQQVSGPHNDFVRALVKTMRRTFPEVYIFECANDTNAVLVALKRAQGLSRGDILSRAKEVVNAGLVRRTAIVSDAENYADLEVRTDDVPVLTDDFAPVDRLLGR